MLIKWDRKYGELFRDVFFVLRYFIVVIFEFMYVVLVDYGFVKLCINYSHLILEHVCFVTLSASVTYS